MNTRRVALAGAPNGGLRGAPVLLERSGYSVVSVHELSELEALAEPPVPDLVIVEQSFGPDGGVAACRRLRNMPAFSAVSLMLAVPAGEQHLEECLVAGINDFILTPFPADELLDKVSRLTAIPARRELNTLVRVREARPDGETLLGKTLNVSLNGILIEIESLLPIGRVFDVEFFLPEQADALRASGRVTRRALELDLFHPAFGLRWVALADADASRIEAFVERREGSPGSLVREAGP